MPLFFYEFADYNNIIFTHFLPAFLKKTQKKWC